MQCREVRDLLDSFLGQELLVETNHELMRHLESCPDCRGELEARRHLRAALGRAFTHAAILQPPPHFATNALAGVRAATVRQNRRSVLVRWGALAASAVLVTGIGLYVAGNRVSAIVRDAVGDHRNCALKFALTERPIPLAEAAARFDPIYARLQDMPPNDVATVAGPLHIVDRHSCVFDGRRFGHVIMQVDGHLVSILVTADGQLPAGETLEPSSALTWLPAVDGQRVASFHTTGHVTFIVGDLEEQPFRQVAQALVDPLFRRLTAFRRNIFWGLGD